MADNVFLKATFKCPQCSHSFNVKHPLKACTATITCPQCKGKFMAKFEAVPDDVLKKLAAQQAQAAAAAAAPKPAPQEEDSETKAVSFRTASSNKMAKLVVVKGFLSMKTRYDLKVGENVIGREDPESPSDIQLKDSAVSRRSVSIFVTKGNSGYEYRFTINKATNPVTVNGQEKRPGESIYLKTNDVIRLGKTKLYLEEK